MTITYSCIVNGRSVLADLALSGGSYQETAATVLRLVLLRAERKTIIQMGRMILETTKVSFSRGLDKEVVSFIYHSLFIDGITYLCASDNALDTVTPSAFLKNVSDTFLRNPLMSQEHFSPSNAVAADFQQVLGNCNRDAAFCWLLTGGHFQVLETDSSSLPPKMKYSKNQDNSSLSTLRSQVTDVKNVMTQNINKILKSEERLNIFTDRTDDLHTTAKDSKKTRKILRRIWWKHFKKIIIITVAILLSIIIILLSTNVIPT